MQKKSATAPVAFLLALALPACLPAALDKYRNKDKLQAKDSADGGEVPPPSELLPRGDASAPPPTTRQSRTARSAPAASREAREAAPARATIYAVDRQTYRFSIREAEVWDAALNVLLRNYNLTIVDRQNGILSTEWDSYYLNQAVFRNKLSLRLSRSAGGAVDLTVHNNVERLRDASQAAGTVGAVWLPSQDPANEVGRIVQNMALVLNQPPPVLPPSAGIAKVGETSGDQLSR